MGKMRKTSPGFKRAASGDEFCVRPSIPNNKLRASATRMVSKSRVILFIVLLSVIELATGSKASFLDCKKKTQRFACFCRGNILSPLCRGLQKRDLLERLYENRLPPMEEEVLKLDRAKTEALINNSLLLRQLLRPAEVSSESDLD